MLFCENRRIPREHATSQYNSAINSQRKCCLMLNCFVIEEIPVFEAGGPPVEERRDHLNNSQEEER